jgi:hypothetical protein
MPHQEPTDGRVRTEPGTPCLPGRRHRWPAAIPAWASDPTPGVACPALTRGRLPATATGMAPIQDSFMHHSGLHQYSGPAPTHNCMAAGVPPRCATRDRGGLTTGSSRRTAGAIAAAQHPPRNRLWGGRLRSVIPASLGWEPGRPLAWQPSTGSQRSQLSGHGSRAHAQVIWLANRCSRRRCKELSGGHGVAGNAADLAMV